MISLLLLITPLKQVDAALHGAIVHSHTRTLLINTKACTCLITVTKAIAFAIVGAYTINMMRWTSDKSLNTILVVSERFVAVLQAKDTQHASSCAPRATLLHRRKRTLDSLEGSLGD